MAYELKSGIPVPFRGRRNGKYPWLDMNIGQCFLIEDRNKPLVISKAVRSTGKKFRQVVNPEIDGKKFDGLGVWRTA